MPIYQVHITKEVSTTIDVEADSPEDARDRIAESPGYPGTMVHGAFGSGASVDEAAEWEPYAVMLGNEELWTRD